jgi:hypothetical protein
MKQLLDLRVKEQRFNKLIASLCIRINLAGKKMKVLAFHKAV